MMRLCIDADNATKKCGEVRRSGERTLYCVLGQLVPGSGRIRAWVLPGGGLWGVWRRAISSTVEASSLN